LIVGLVGRFLHQQPEVRLMQDVAHLLRSSAGARHCHAVMYLMFFERVNIFVSFALSALSWAL
jgi:hypothetical protein